MNAAHQPSLRPGRLVVISLAVTLVAGIAVGWFSGSATTTASDYVHALADPVFFGALSIMAARRGTPAGYWAPVLLMAVFLLDIALYPHVMVLSVLGLSAGAIALLATRHHQRVAVASAVACSALLGATLVAGVWLH